MTLSDEGSGMKRDCDDAGAKASRRTGKDPAIDEELNTIRPANTQQLPADAQESRGKRLASARSRLCEASRARSGRRQIDAGMVVAAGLPQAASHPAC
jgi:hypothetical protein